MATEKNDNWILRSFNEWAFKPPYTFRLQPSGTVSLQVKCFGEESLCPDMFLGSLCFLREPEGEGEENTCFVKGGFLHELVSGRESDVWISTLCAGVWWDCIITRGPETLNKGSVWENTSLWADLVTRRDVPRKYTATLKEMWAELRLEVAASVSQGVDSAWVAHNGYKALVYDLCSPETSFDPLQKKYQIRISSKIDVYYQIWSAWMQKGDLRMSTIGPPLSTSIYTRRYPHRV
jgi:hypothetical protein